MFARFVSGRDLQRRRRRRLQAVLVSSAQVILDASVQVWLLGRPLPAPIAIQLEIPNRIELVLGEPRKPADMELVSPTSMPKVAHHARCMPNAALHTVVELSLPMFQLATHGPTQVGRL